MILQTNAPGTGGGTGSSVSPDNVAFKEHSGFEHGVNNTALATLGVPVHNDNSAITYAVVTGTRTFSFGDAGKTFNKWSAGTKSSLTGVQTVVWDDVEGDQLIYFPAGSNVLTNANSGSIPSGYSSLKDFVDSELIRGSACFVSYFYWDAVNKEIITDTPMVEGHGGQMDGATHYDQHDGIGAKWYSGLALSVVVAGTDATRAQYAITGGHFGDEDLRHNVTAVDSTTAIPVVFLTGSEASPLLRQLTSSSGWKHVTGAELFAAGYTDAPNVDRIVYNYVSGGVWTFGDPGDNDFVNYHTHGIGNTGQKLYNVMGQVEYANAAAARAGADSEITTIAGLLPFPEVRPLGTVIFQTNDTWAISNYARATEANDGNYVDWRKFSIPGGTGGITSNFDADAIHSNAAGEINAITAKATPVSGDKLVIEDSEDSFNKKSVPISAFPTGLITATTTIAVIDWSANEATKAVSGVTASNLIFVAPSPASAEDYASAGIIASAQGVNSITFTCTETPTSAIDVNIVIGD